MLNLKLRDEFLGSQMPGTAIARRRKDNSGAAQRTPDFILSITYPTADVQTALRAVSTDRSKRPIVLMGDRGRGKSHIMAVMHHAVESSSQVQKWANEWGNRPGAQPLSGLVLDGRFFAISEPVHNHEYTLLWDLIFERHPRGDFFRGKFNQMGRPYPPRSLLEEMFEAQPVALILDEFQKWFDGLSDQPGPEGIKYRTLAENFIRNLSELSRDRPDLLILVVSVLNNNTEAFRQVHRDGPVIVDFREPTAKEDRKNLLQYRLFENRQTIPTDEIRSLLDSYASERFRLRSDGVKSIYQDAELLFCSRCSYLTSIAWRDEYDQDRIQQPHRTAGEADSHAPSFESQSLHGSEVHQGGRRRMSTPAWLDIILDSPSPTDAWSGVFARLRELAVTRGSPVDLHNQTIAPDRLLAETAWELWGSYPEAAPRTATHLKEWCAAPSSIGRAVLVLDALSLREMPWLLGGAQARHIQPSDVRVTGAEAPFDTDQFAHALGVPSRSHLAGNGAPGSFNLFPSKAYTDVISVPFEDAVGGIPHESNVFVWHSWLDDLIHVHKKLPDQIYKTAAATLQDDGFWKFVNRLRQGRKLVITSDHGYAVSKLFSSEEIDPDVIERLRETFGAARYKKVNGPWQERFMPPIVVSMNEHHIVMGQRKWQVQGGFPHVCHGGLAFWKWPCRLSNCRHCDR